MLVALDTAARRHWRRAAALLATVVLAGSAVTNSAAAAPAAPVASAAIVVHAGGVRTGTSTVTGLAGAIFQAVPVGGGAAVPCTTGVTGTCTILVASGVAYSVSESTPPAGWYLEPNLDFGGGVSGTSTPYRFQTGRLAGGTSTDVPGTALNGSYSDGVSPGSPFSGALATSLANPSASSQCGLRIALILDQSGSMAAGTKQADLKAAAKKVITTLTGTPSQMAIYTFASNTGGRVALTSMQSTATAAPLTNFVNALPAPSGSTNWDQGFFQAVTASKQYDLVVVLTDGNPTTDHNGIGAGGQTNFHNIENGIYSANAIKAVGSRLVAIGIGVQGGQENLRAISGQTLNSDYFLGSDSNFDETFKTLATGNCNGVLTVQKDIQDFNGNPIPNSPAANGWNFAGSVSSPAANLAFPATATFNGATGFTQTTVTIPAGGTPTVAVAETLTAGYTFVGAICSVNGVNVGTTPTGNATHPGVSFTAAAAVPLACTFTNKQPPPLSSLAVQKLDGSTNLPVPGATFQLYREVTPGTVVGATPVGTPCTTAGTPAQCVSNSTLSFGTYFWTETGAPAGYVLPIGAGANSAAFTIDATHTGTPVATLTVADAEITSSLAIAKLDGATRQSVAGATFVLHRETTVGTQNPAGDPAIGAPCTTAGSPAQCVSAATLTFGTYYWVETVAPAGYVLPSGSAAYSAAYTIDAGHTGTPVSTLTVNDAQIGSSLAVRKLDGTTSLPVAGATFQLYREVNAGTVVGATPVGAPCTTAGTPAQCVSAATLTFGTYFWTETAAPAGYVLPVGAAVNSAAFTIDATHTGTPVATLTVADAEITSSLAIQKLDSTTHQAVAGATFQLYREAVVGTRNPAADTAIGVPCTTAGSPAQCTSAATLTFGTYYWVETGAPAGYVLPSGSAAYSTPYPIDAAHTGTPVATLSVSDDEITSALAIKKLDATTNQSVAGAIFELYREAVVGTRNPAVDTPVAPCTTTTTSACTVLGLTFGTYYWVETTAPGGYVLPPVPNRYSDPITIDVAYAVAGKTSTLTVSDMQILSSVAVQKIDGTTQLPVAGAVFQLHREGTVGIKAPATDQAIDGPCTTAGAVPQCMSSQTLTFGTYYWVETAAPTGYVLPAAPATSDVVLIDAAHTGAPVATVSFSDAQILSRLAVQKLDSRTASAVDGATFQLYRELGAARQPGTDTQIGTPCTTAALNTPADTCSQGALTFGSYYWVETAAPVGYVLPSDTQAYSAVTTIDATYAAAGATAVVTVSDAQILSSLAVRKLDATTSQAVDGASFQLYRERNTGTQDPTVDAPVGAACTTAAASTPADGCSATGLAFGTYYWVETAAPTGYVLPAGPLSYTAPQTIDAAYADAGRPAILVVFDPQVLSSLAVRKVDSTTGAAVGGATFQLYRVGSAGAADTPVGVPCVTGGAAATCESAATLTFGTYYWVEIAAPPGYTLPVGAAANSAPTTIDATHTGTPVATVAVDDAQILSSLSVQKNDEAGQPLSGARFELWHETNAQVDLQRTGADPDTAVGQCTTVADGACSIGGLGFGTYYWVEIQAPTFFELPENPVSAPIVVTAANAGTTPQPVVFVDPAEPVATVTKTVVSTTQLANGTWTIVYHVAVSDPSVKYATVYELTDALAFGAGITVNSATVAGPAGVTLASPAWDGAGQPVVVSHQPLGAGATDDYTVTVNATVAAGASSTCASGGGFANTSHVSLQAGQSPNARAVAILAAGASAQDAAACSEPVSPTLAKSFGSAEQHLVGGVWDGTWDVTYAVTVSNPSDTTGLVYSLSDQPGFPADVTINGATVTGSDGINPIAGVAADWNGTSQPVIVTGRALPASGIDTYTVLVNATVPVDADPAELACADAGSGHGFFNLATATSGSDTFTADACGDIPPVTMPIIAKTVTSNVQNPDGTWTVTYDLAVTNPDAALASTYDLSDALGLGHGITVTGATVTGPAGASVNPAWNGVDQTAIVTHRSIAADSTEDYTVVVHASVGTTATTTDRDCTLSTDEEGTGFLNGATLTFGALSQTSTACAAPGSPSVVKRFLSQTAGSTAGTWVIAYSVTVSNASAADVTYSLVDHPGLASGTIITGTDASWTRAALDGSGAGPATGVAGWTGTAPHDALAAARVLPSGSRDTYLVTIDVTVPSDIDAGVLACSAAGSGHGFFNAAVLTAGADTFPVSACAPTPNAGVDAIVIPPPPPHGSSGGATLALTGSSVLPLLLQGAGLLALGLALLLSTRRRRRA